MIGFRSTFWVSLIKIVSIVDAINLQTSTFCIRVGQEGICPGENPLVVHGKILVQSGFAPWSVGDVKRKPKWEDEFDFDTQTEDELVVFSSDYCFFTKDVDRVRWRGCAQECHRGGVEFNPWYGFNSRGNTPDYSDPVAGQHNRYLPTTRNTCPNPNFPLTSQSETGSGNLASNELQLPTGDSTAADTTVIPSFSPGVFGVQEDSQNQFYPENQGTSVNSVLGFERANALPPSTSDDGALITADTFSDLFPTPGSNYLTSDPPGIAKNTVIGSAGTTTENTSPVAFNLDTLGNLPLFRKRDAKRARDFRL